MRNMLALLAVAAGLLGFDALDRALLGRSMASLKPPKTPAALQALLQPPDLPPPPPPPPPPGLVAATP